MALFDFNSRSLFAVIYFILVTLKYPKSLVAMSRINEVHDCLTLISFRTRFDKSMVGTNKKLACIQTKINESSVKIRCVRCVALCAT